MTAADQPTTEPRWGVAKFRYDHTRCACGGFDLDYLITGWSQGDQVVQDVIRHPAQRVHHRGCEKAPAPQPAADTERDERLRGIQERCEGVTLGPWFHEPRGGQNQNGDFSGMCIYDGHGEYLVHDVSDTDGAFIASARTDVPWLLSEVARLDAVVTAVREEHVPRWVPNYDGDSDLVCSCGHIADDEDDPCPTARALDGGASDD